MYTGFIYTHTVRGGGWGWSGGGSGDGGGVGVGWGGVRVGVIDMQFSLC